MWCVIECGSEGEIFEPEFFQNEKEAMKYRGRFERMLCNVF